MTRQTYNERLQPMPSHEQIAAVMYELESRYSRSGRYFTAQTVAYAARVEPARRLGNGAVKGSWSGMMSPALRITPTLRAMHRAGLVALVMNDDGRFRWHYGLTEAGREMARSQVSVRD